MVFTWLGRGVAMGGPGSHGPANQNEFFPTKGLYYRPKYSSNSLNYLATALVDIPAGSMPIACSLKTWKLHILEWPFIVPSTRCACVMIMLFNHLLDMPHLSGGWVNLATEKCLVTGMQTHLWTTFERNKLFVRMENFWNLLFQFMKHGTNTWHVALIFLFSVNICCVWIV